MARQMLCLRGTAVGRAPDGQPRSVAGRISKQIPNEPIHEQQQFEYASFDDPCHRDRWSDPVLSDGERLTLAEPPVVTTMAGGFVLLSTIWTMRRPCGMLLCGEAAGSAVALPVLLVGRTPHGWATVGIRLGSSGFSGRRGRDDARHHSDSRSAGRGLDQRKRTSV